MPMRFTPRIYSQFSTGTLINIISLPHPYDIFFPIICKGKFCRFTTSTQVEKEIIQIIIPKKLLPTIKACVVNAFIVLIHLQEKCPDSSGINSSFDTSIVDCLEASSNRLLPKHSTDVITTNRIVPAICKHVMSIEALSRGQIRILIDKPTPRRIIIPALQIVQPRFRVVDVSAVAQGVGRAKRRCHCTGGGQRVAPCVVGVGHDARAAGADKAGHVALCVLDVKIFRAVVVHGQWDSRVVGEVQLIAVPRQLHQLVAQIMVIVRRTVDGFRDALAVGIVAVGDIRPGLAHPRELAAVLPCVRPRAIAQKVANLVRRQALPADAREQIAPRGVVVAIGNGAHRRAEGSGRIGVFRFAPDVAAVIVGIRPRLPRRLIVLAHELVEAVVGIGRRALAVGDGRDVPARVVGVGIRRRAGFPRPDLPRGRRGRGIVVADRGLDHGLPWSVSCDTLQRNFTMLIGISAPLRNNTMLPLHKI